MVPAGWQFFKWLLGWGEHIEFLAHRVHDIKYVGPMLEFILNPPPWLALALVPPGLALVYWGNRPTTETVFDFSKLSEVKDAPPQTPREAEISDIMTAADIEPHVALEAESPSAPEEKPKLTRYKNRRLLDVTPKFLMELYEDRPKTFSQTSIEENGSCAAASRRT
jgi:hypothetical protein